MNMINMIPVHIRQHFGLADAKRFESPVFKSYRDDIVKAVEDNAMVVISGNPGAGKTILFDSVKEKCRDAKSVDVYVRNYYKENLTIGSVINAAIYDLAELYARTNGLQTVETPKRDLEARSRQFTRIVGTLFHNHNYKIKIIIEEAHRPHINTLRALKELRETSFAGYYPLFSLILIGHPELADKVEKRKEVYWRALHYELNENCGWFEEREREEFIKNIFGSVIESGARKTIAKVCKEPLQIINYVGKVMKDAKRAGYSTINQDIVKPTLKQLYDSQSLTYGEIAKKLNYPKSTVYVAVNDPNFKNEETISTIKKLLTGSDAAVSKVA